MSISRGLCRSLMLAAGLGAGLSSSGALAVTGAELIRSTPHRHGRFEARLMFAPGDGILSSLFLWKLGSEAPDAVWHEIDIEKVRADCRGYSSNVIFGNPEAHATRRVQAAGDLCAEYHTHAVESRAAWRCCR